MSKIARPPRIPLKVEELGDANKSLRRELNRGSALSCALVGGACLEQALMSLLSKYFVECKRLPGKKVEYEECETIFDAGNGTLATFSNCNHLAFCLGLFDRDTFENLKAVGSIRNRFAHSTKRITFDDETVAYWCNKFMWPAAETEEGIAIPLNPLKGFAGNNNRSLFILIVLASFSRLILNALSTEHRKAPERTKHVHVSHSAGL
jgi:DNA-binding MltR family transcriptional regulator